MKSLTFVSVHGTKALAVWKAKTKRQTPKMVKPTFEAICGTAQLAMLVSRGSTSDRYRDCTIGGKISLAVRPAWHKAKNENETVESSERNSFAGARLALELIEVKNSHRH